ncbi:7894_t:CDS:2, partial [Cetraspora pellucida]
LHLFPLIYTTINNEILRKHNILIKVNIQRTLKLSSIEVSKIVKIPGTQNLIRLTNAITEAPRPGHESTSGVTGLSRRIELAFKALILKVSGRKHNIKINRKPPKIAKSQKIHLQPRYCAMNPPKIVARNGPIQKQTELPQACMERITVNNQIFVTIAHTTDAEINTKREATYTFFLVASSSE